jgi:hypothetical protein
VVCTSLQVLNTGVSHSDLQDLVESFGSDVAVVNFEVTSAGVGRGLSSAKRNQATNSRHYMHTLTGSPHVFTGLVYFRHPNACHKSLDFVFDIDEPASRRYLVASNLALDFKRSGDSGKNLLGDGDRQLSEKILELHRATGISLADFHDLYRDEGHWERIGPFFPEYSQPEFYGRLARVRGLTLELVTGLDVAMRTPKGGVIVRQPYSFADQQHGFITSDVDVMLIATKEHVIETFSSLKHEPDTKLILKDPGLRRNVEQFEQKAPYERAA